jgi:preprotein translocase subunit SecG
VVERNLDRFTLVTGLVWFASIIGLLLLFKG